VRFFTVAAVERLRTQQRQELAVMVVAGLETQQLQVAQERLIEGAVAAVQQR
jgi:hypothetical protein